MAGVLFARSIGYYRGMKHKIKNLTNSPYALAAVGGAVTVPARGEIVAEFDAHQLQAVKSVGYFKVEEVAELKAEAPKHLVASMADDGAIRSVPEYQPKRGRPRKDS